jgi:hypothetical protein
VRSLVVLVVCILPLGVSAQTKSHANFATGQIVVQPAADIGAAINAAVAESGPGKYVLMPGQYKSATTINPSSSIALECAEVGNIRGGESTQGACVITVAAGTDGFTCLDATARRSSIKGIHFFSANTSADIHNGINISCQGFHAEDVVVQKFGQDGFHFDSGSGLADFWSLTNVMSMVNFRDGYYFIGSDTNAGTCTNCVSVTNGGYGLDTSAGGASNIFMDFSETLSTLGSYRLGNYSQYIESYCESPGTMTIIGSYNIVLATGFSACGTITESVPNTNYIAAYSSVLPGIAHNELFIGPTPGQGGPYYFGFRSGFVGATFFEIVDQHALIDAALYNSIDSSWVFPASVKASTFKTTNMLVSNAAPTIISGFGATAPSIPVNNGPSAFRVNVGTGVVANTGVIGLPTATTGWNCFAQDLTTLSASTFMTRVTASTASSVTLGNFSDTGTAGPWIASDVLEVSCLAY